MDPVSAFCWAMVDLDACTRSSYHYHQLRIAGLVRLLAFDESPLAAQVNRTYRLKLSFRHLPGVTDARPAAGDENEIAGVKVGFANLAPTDPAALSETVLTSSLVSWLRTGALRIAARVLTVQEFVQQMAYVEGLTHAQRPRDDEEQQLVAIRDRVRVFDFSEPNLFVLKQIGRVTHAGLHPLFDRAKTARERLDGPYPRFVYEAAT